MTEKLNPVRFLRDAFAEDFRSIDSGRWEADRYPMDVPEKVAYILKTFFSKKEFRSVVKRFSSLNYGIQLSYAVFPKSENPGEFHSRNGEVALGEHVVQVLGWKEYEAKIDEGVKQGLDKLFIERGFDKEAEKRGIDLEWSFFEKAPKENTDPLLSGKIIF